MLKPQFNDHVSFLSMSFQIFQLQLSRINLDPVLEIRGAPRPQGSAFGDTIFGSNGEKDGTRFPQHCGFSRDFTGEMFDFQRCLCFLF